MVNGGNLIKPTIVEKIYNPNTKQRVINKPQVIDKIFSAKTSEDIKLALYKVIYEGDLPMLAISGYTLG
jgi:cell division protein FtsI/penicillin-binding protein 2